MATYVWVDIGSGNGLLFDGNRPLAEPMFSLMGFCDTFPRQISLEVLEISIGKMSLKNTFVKLLPHFPRVLTDMYLLVLVLPGRILNLNHQALYVLHLLQIQTWVPTVPPPPQSLHSSPLWAAPRLSPPFTCLISLTTSPPLPTAEWPQKTAMCRSVWTSSESWMISTVGHPQVGAKNNSDNSRRPSSHVIPPHWHDTGSWNPSSSRTRTYIFYTVNIMGADVLATQGARASATMILT